VAIVASGSVEIAAPAAAVFPWLTEREKLAQWVGGNQEMMPASSSELVVGYRGAGTYPGPGGAAEEMVLEVNAVDAPHQFSYTQSYAEGVTAVEYALTESGGRTHVAATSTTEWRTSGTDMFNQVEQQIASLPAYAREISRRQLAQVEEQMAHTDSNPAVEAEMNRRFAESLENLKRTVEAAAGAG
jgi:uncharacterized protein YndB with AHSA1/START domain